MILLLVINQHVIITLGLANECVKILSFPAVHLAKKQKLHACSQHPRLQLAPALAASTHARSHHDMRAASTGGGAQPKKNKLNITHQTLNIRLTRSKFKDL